MVRWRYCLVLAVLLLLPACNASEEDDEDEDPDNGDNEDTEDGNDPDEDEDDDSPKNSRPTLKKIPPILRPSPSTMKVPTPVTRTVKKKSLECYVCSFKSEVPLRSCLDPAKFRVHTITCHNIEDKCFTSVVSKGNMYEAVVRGCRSGCIGTPETTCCELNRCNNQAFAMPPASHHSLKSTNGQNKSLPPSIFFFVTVLLLLQTVAKVSFV